MSECKICGMTLLVGDSDLCGDCFYKQQCALQADGMTLRDYFAAAALMGQCANPDCEPEDVVHNAIVAYRNADAMLAQRSSSQ